MFSVITELQRMANKIFRWFEINNMKANPRKSHVLLNSNKQRVVPFDNVQLLSRSNENFLGITFNSGLKFAENISEICNIGNKKLNAFRCITNRKNLDKPKCF